MDNVVDEAGNSSEDDEEIIGVRSSRHQTNGHS
jgi:hypothetical protein